MPFKHFTSTLIHFLFPIPPTLSFTSFSHLGIYVPLVPEPQNLNERKLVRGKKRRKKGGSGQMITQPRFGADQRDYESIRSPFAQ